MNFPYLLDVQAGHAAWIIARALERGVAELEPSAEAEAAWVDTVVARSAASAERAQTCTPGYYNREGRADAKTRQGSFFFGAPTEYADILAAWRAAGDMAGLETRGGHRMTSRRARRLYAVGRLRAATRRGRPPKVAIIGAGFGGLGAAVALRRAGVDDLVIIEGDDGVGGTWRRNTYPGAACDVQSHLYSFSFALNKSWSRTYARQPEILAYLESVADDFDLRRHLILRTHARSARWNEDTAQWELQLRQANSDVTTTLRADVVVSAVGLFAESKLPDIEGLSGYRGRLMHTSAWDASADLAGRKIAVIGTGASAVQVVPEFARIAARVSVFQRTPPWMVPKDDRPFSAGELARFRRSPWAARRERWRIWKQFHDFAGSAVDDPQVAGRAQSRHLRSHGPRRAAARITDPRLPVPVQAGAARRRLLPCAATGSRRLRGRPVAGVTETSFAPPPGTRSTSSDRLATGFRPASTSTALTWSGATGRACTSGGATTRRPTSASPSAVSRISSCSMAPTPTRAATRSSTSSRPVRDWWPAR